MSKLHPDRHTLKPPEEQERLTQEASQVTRAYGIITNPHSRAVHLLDLLGKPLEEASTVRKTKEFSCSLGAPSLSHDCF